MDPLLTADTCLVGGAPADATASLLLVVGMILSQQDSPEPCQSAGCPHGSSSMLSWPQEEGSGLGVQEAAECAS